MSDIKVKDLLAATKRALPSPQGSTTFHDSFITATRLTISDLNNDVDLETQLTQITDADTATINLDTDKYFTVMLTGIRFHMVDLGERAPKNTDVNVLFLRYSREKLVLYADKSNEKQEDLTNNIVGLGAGVSVTLT